MFVRILLREFWKRKKEAMEGVCWEKRRAMTASVVSRPVLLTAYVIEAFFGGFEECRRHQETDLMVDACF